MRGQMHERVAALYFISCLKSREIVAPLASIFLMRAKETARCSKKTIFSIPTEPPFRVDSGVFGFMQVPSWTRLGELKLPFLTTMLAHFKWVMKLRSLELCIRPVGICVITKKVLWWYGRTIATGAGGLRLRH